jgi:CheY-like chemotaxis protein
MSSSTSRQKIRRDLAVHRVKRACARPLDPNAGVTPLAAKRPNASSQPATAGALALLDPPAVETAPTRKPAAARKTILIVEDDLRLAGLIRAGLELEGEPEWAVQSAGAGRHALELAGASVPDVVLLDVYLPDLDGAEVYNRLRESPATRGARVLFLSACTQPDLWQRDIEDGVLLRKPFDVRELVAIVRALLQG